MVRVTKLVVVGRGEPERGGIPSYISWMAIRARQAGYTTALLNLAPVGGSKEGVNTSNLARTLSDVIRVWRASQGAKVVAIHSAGAPTQSLVRLGLLALAARVGGSSAVVHVHGGRLPLWATTRRRRALLRLAVFPASVVVAVAEDGYDLISHTAPGTHTEWIPNGVDTARFVPAGDNGKSDANRKVPEPTVLFVGGLTERKGVLDLVEACRLLRGRGIPHRLLLVGGRPNEGLEAYDQVKAALPVWVEVAGPTEPAEMPSVYQSADIFCLPSWWEAMPLTVLEAMACGLAVVASDVGDVRKLVNHGVTGLVVPPREPTALADALALLMTDAEASSRMGAAGRTSAVSSYDSEATWIRFEAVLRRLAAPT